MSGGGADDQPDKRVTKPIVNPTRNPNPVKPAKPHHDFPLTAPIHRLGHIGVTRIHRTGDEKAGPATAMLFDERLKRVSNGGDAVAIAGRPAWVCGNGN